MKSEGFKVLTIRVPAKHHLMLKKLAADLGVTSTDIIANYLDWLSEQHWKKRTTINADSKEKFDVERIRPE
jgi:hypothetical protein